MDLAKKLQLTGAQQVETLDAPPSVAPLLADRSSGDGDAADAALLVFVLDRAALEGRRPEIAAAASRDRLTWVAYPKAGKLGSDLNRDSLAALLTESGVQPVRQIAIDDVWSALRFRPA